jgi:translation initiation factor 3 subunit I
VSFSTFGSSGIVSNLRTDSVAVDPTGKSYASGGEDGYVRVHQFDKGYFDFAYEVERQAKAQGQM